MLMFSFDVAWYNSIYHHFGSSFFIKVSIKMSVVRVNDENDLDLCLESCQGQI